MFVFHSIISISNKFYMGNLVSPLLANIFMDNLESKAFSLNKSNYIICILV